MALKFLALVVGSSIMVIGILALVRPDYFVELVRPTVTPTGLYVVAAIRIGIGVILFLASGRSRAPTALRVFGVLAFLAGLATAAIGTDRARAILDWWSGQGPALVGLTGAVALAFGALITYLLVTPGADMRRR